MVPFSDAVQQYFAVLLGLEGTGKEEDDFGVGLALGSHGEPPESGYYRGVVLALLQAENIGVPVKNASSRSEYKDGDVGELGNHGGNDSTGSKKQGVGRPSQVYGLGWLGTRY